MNYDDDNDDDDNDDNDTADKDCNNKNNNDNFININIEWIRMTTTMTQIKTITAKTTTKTIMGIE